MKGTFFKLKDQSLEKPHFWVIISDEKNGRFLSVNITDEKNCASPCSISIGDHVEIYKPSVIAYKRAMLLSKDKLQKIDQFAVVFEPSSQELLDKIIAAAFQTEDVSPYLLQWLE